jgi:hypothetical protein
MILYELESQDWPLIEHWPGWTYIDTAAKEAKEACSMCCSDGDGCPDPRYKRNYCIYKPELLPNALARASKLARLLGNKGGPLNSVSCAFVATLPAVDPDEWVFLLGWIGSPEPGRSGYRRFIASPYPLPWLDDSIDSIDVTCVFVS